MCECCQEREGTWRFGHPKFNTTIGKSQYESVRLCKECEAPLTVLVRLILALR